MLAKAAEFYEEEVDEMVKGLSSLMEPFIIVILGVLIGIQASNWNEARVERQRQVAQWKARGRAGARRTRGGGAARR